MNPALLGWGASFILLFTILHQIYTQWRTRTAAGVSWFLFIGQALASAGFVAYSVIVEDVVFIFTNSVLLASHFAGLILTWRQKGTGRA